MGGHLQVQSNQQHKSRFKKVNLLGAKVGGDVQFAGVTVDGDLNASTLVVGTNLHLSSTEQDKGKFKNITLAGARVGGSFRMDGATLDGIIEAPSLQVGLDVVLYNAVLTKRVTMSFARVGGSFDMRSASVAELHLTGASIAGDFILGGNDPAFTSVAWREDAGTGGPHLRNARIASLVDAPALGPEPGICA